jgi:hypothetical protein
LKPSGLNKRKPKEKNKAKDKTKKAKYKINNQLLQKENKVGDLIYENLIIKIYLNSYE